jgi:hypothetical protein
MTEFSQGLSEQFFGYDIFHEGKMEIIREASYENEFDGDDTYTYWTIGTEIMASDSGFANIVTTLKLEHDKPYYLVCYSTSAGDSFSIDKACNLFFLDVFTDLKKAQHVIELMKKNDKPTFSYVDDSGFERIIESVWYDYFQPVHEYIIKPVSLDYPLKKQNHLQQKQEQRIFSGQK